VKHKTVETLKDDVTIHVHDELLHIEPGKVTATEADAEREVGNASDDSPIRLLFISLFLYFYLNYPNNTSGCGQPQSSRRVCHSISFEPYHVRKPVCSIRNSG